MGRFNNRKEIRRLERLERNYFLLQNVRPFHSESIKDEKHYVTTKKDADMKIVEIYVYSDLIGPQFV